MKLQELNNKEYLLSLSKSRDLKEMIRQSHGFVLYLMQRHSIIPDKELIMDSVSVFSLNFILRNYELTENEKKEFTKYFYRTEKVINKEAFTQEDFMQRLQNGESVPEDFTLDYKTLFNNQETLLGIDNGELVADIVKKSTDLFTKEQVLSLNKFHENYYHEVLNKKEFLEDKNYRDFYLKLIENDKNTICYNALMHLNFTKEDQSFADKIFSRLPKYGSYADIKRVPGLTQVISAIKYLSINSEKLADIEVKPETIKEIRHNFQIKSLIHNASDDWKKLDLIIDDSMMGKLFKDDSIAKMYHNSIFLEDRPSDKQAFLTRKVLNYMLSNPDTVSNNDYYIQKFLTILNINIDNNPADVLAKKTLSDMTIFCLQILIENKDYLSLERENNHYNIFCYQEALSQSSEFTTPSFEKYYFLELLNNEKNTYSAGLSYNSLNLDNFNTLIERYREKLPENEVKFIQSFFSLNSVQRSNYLKDFNLDIEKISKNQELLNFILSHEINVFEALEGKALNKEILQSLISVSQYEQKSELIDFIKKYNEKEGLSNECLNIVTNSSIGEFIISLKDKDNNLWTQLLESVGEEKKEDIGKYLNNMSSPYLEQKLKDTLNSKNYELFIQLEEVGGYAIKDTCSQLLKEYIKTINSKEFLSMLNNKELVRKFISFFTSFSKEENNFTLDLDKSECIELVAKIQEIPTYADWDNIMSTIVNKDNMKTAFIEKYPHIILSRGSLEISYTSDEVITAYQNYIKENSVFIEKYNKYFMNDMHSGELEKLLEKSKAYPEFYAMLLPESCMTLARKSGKQGNNATLDSLVHDYFIQFYDKDTFGIALDKLLQEKKKYQDMREQKEKIEEKNNLIRSLIRVTYHTKGNDYFSNLSNEDSCFIVEKLFPENIDCYLSFNTIGSLVKNNDNFTKIFSKSNTSIVDLVHSVENLNHYNIDSFLDLLINHYVKINDDLSLCYIKYMKEQSNFLEEVVCHVKEDTPILKGNFLFEHIIEDRHNEILELFDSRFFLSTSLIQEKVAKKKVNKL